LNIRLRLFRKSVIQDFFIKLNEIMKIKYQ